MHTIKVNTLSNYWQECFLLAQDAFGRSIQMIVIWSTCTYGSILVSYFKSLCDGPLIYFSMIQERPALALL